MPKKKTGGRRAGIPNKITGRVAESLDAIGCNPIIEMAMILMDTENEVGIRFAAAKELAAYVAPKRKPLEENMLEEVAEADDRELYEKAMADLIEFGKRLK